VFKPDGTKVFVLDTGAGKVIQYTLSTPWNISTAITDSVEVTISSENGLFFKPDGTRFYVIGSGTDIVRQYNLPSAWDLTGATSSTSFYVGSQNSGMQSLSFKADGTKMYAYGNGSTRGLYQYSLSSPWVVDNAMSYDSVFKNFFLATGVNGIAFKPDGTRFYMVIPNNDAVRQYNLSTPWDITSTALEIEKNINPPANFTFGIDFKPDGTKMYVGTSALDTIYQFDL
jgi:sugar lactone lactonase YvrE